jgi:glycosyltransferase involved in cell wall biosynthesis
MKIAINAEKLNHQKSTGVENYVKNLIAGLAELSDLPPIYLFMRDIPPVDQKIPASAKIIYLKNRYFYGEYQLPRALRDYKIDVFFEPARTLPIFLSKNLKSVITIHDLAFLLFPKAYPLKYRLYTTLLTSLSLKKATKIIAVSETTKKDILKFFKVAAEKIVVIREASQLTNEEKKPTLLDNERPYFLFLGRLERRKNLISLVKAFGLLRKERLFQPLLVLAGKPGFGFSEIEQEIASLGDLKKDILLLNYVDEKEKSYLLRHAKALVFPSLYEGFGIPILEAMSVGTPVITSNFGAMQETAGEAALLVNPLKPLEIAAAMSKILHIPKLSEKLRKEGIKRAQMFSWQKTAKETISLLEEVYRQ